ncbi:MAG: PKD domain-containing protein, partial [Hydrocarboniphaga effusa]|nr:PKD domain-containing protein [Hydrocarboniphaga effusa]
NLTPGISATSYTFDFGDGSATVTQAGPTVTHGYAADGLYTATVRITDTSGALAQNAGAAQIRVGGVTAGNTEPTALLAGFPLSGAAPLTVGFSASGSHDADVGDEVAVYEFDFGDGVVLRQSTSAANHVYLTQPATEPMVTAIDMSGVRSAPASVAVTVAGTVPATRFVRSNTLSFTAVPATLTAIAISPAAASQQAFAYPGQQFEATGTFSATATDCNTGVCFAGNATTATQKITRFVGWVARPAADSTAFSDIAFVRTFSDDLLHVGQVGYFKNVSADTEVFITASPPVTPLAPVTAPAPATLTVTPCPAETCAP